MKMYFIPEDANDTLVDHILKWAPALVALAFAATFFILEFDAEELTYRILGRVNRTTVRVPRLLAIMIYPILAARNAYEAWDSHPEIARYCLSAAFAGFWTGFMTVVGLTTATETGHLYAYLSILSHFILFGGTVWMDIWFDMNRRSKVLS